jgi:hypothetical protein
MKARRSAWRGPWRQRKIGVVMQVRRRLRVAGIGVCGYSAGRIAWLGCARKVHTLVAGGIPSVPYSKAGDPAGATAGEDFVEDSGAPGGRPGEGVDHRRRARGDRPQLRGAAGNPPERRSSRRQAGQWVWQRGPWLLVDRVTRHVVALKLPDYDPGVSQVSWFRDYGAYCG